MAGSRAADLPFPRQEYARLAVLTRDQASTLAALADAIYPPDDAGPGASQIGAVAYIDAALLGPYKDLRPLYRQGLEALEDLASETAQSGFAALDPAQRQTLLEKIDGAVCRRPSAETAPANLRLLEHFFAVVRQHVMEGLFGDPLYGGNRDREGWRQIGFPGAQWAYAPDAQRPDFDATTLEPLDLAGLRTKRKEG